MVGGWQSGAESSESVMAVVYPLGNKVKGLGEKKRRSLSCGKTEYQLPCVQSRDGYRLGSFGKTGTEAECDL